MSCPFPWGQGARFRRARPFRSFPPVRWEGGLSLPELLVALAVLALFVACVAGVGWQSFKNSSLAISANTLRQLGAGGAAYLADHNHRFWSYRAAGSVEQPGVVWWFGLEPARSLGRAEGSRELDFGGGPLAGYVPGGFRPDPSFAFTGKTFKPKFRQGYLGAGYNVLLGGGWLGAETCKTYWDLPEPGKIVVFATSAQVNTFQRPASAKNPMIEEFYGLDEKEVSVHFRHGGQAMVAFANGSAGFLPLDESTRDTRAPEAEIGRFAPRGSTKYLLPDPE